jgi:hypothetical protein
MNTNIVCSESTERVKEWHVCVLGMNSSYESQRWCLAGLKENSKLKTINISGMGALGERDMIDKLQKPNQGKQSLFQRKNIGFSFENESAFFTCKPT